MTITKKQLLFMSLMTLVLAFVVSAGVLSARKQQLQVQQRETKDWLNVPPEVGSKIKDLEIVNIRLVRPSSTVPGVAFEIKDNSDKAVVSYEVASGDSGISQDGLEDEANPVVLIKPHGERKVEMYDLTEGEPVLITAVVFDDGTEEGEPRALWTIHSSRTHQRAIHRAQREKVSERSPNQ